MKILKDFEKCVTITSVIIIFILFNISSSQTQTLNFTSFTSLPSEQGWSIYDWGPHADMFHVDNGILYQDGIGLGDVAGLFYLPIGTIVNPAESWSVKVRARVLDKDDPTKLSGFVFAITHNNYLYNVALTLDEISLIHSDDRISTSSDNSIFHDFHLTGGPEPTWRLYVDGIFIASGIPLPLSKIPFPIYYDIYFGDGNYHTGNNARGEWASYCFSQPAIPEPNQDFVFLADKNVSISHPNSSEGNIHSNNKIKFKNGNPSTHTGNLTAVNNIKIRKKNTITGDVKAGGSVDNDGTVNGAIEEGAAVPEIPLPSLSFSAGGSHVSVPKNGNLNITPDSYGNVKVHRNGKLYLSSGDYFMKSLNVDKSSVLSIDISEGPVTINVVGSISFDKNVEVDIVPSGESGTAQVIYNSLNGGSIKFRSGVKVLGSIVAPYAKVSLGKNARFKGSICARTISVNNGATFLPHGSSTSLPKAGIVEDSEFTDDMDLTIIPTEYELGQNYPNPFNPSTNIAFAVPEAGEVTLTIFNLRGQLVQTLHSGPIAAGTHKVVWNGTNFRGAKVASGTYVYQLRAKDFVVTKKLVFTK